MGADIHAVVEVGQQMPKEFWWSREAVLELQRDYRMFGLLAGVRSEESPVVPVRGLPMDVPPYFYKDYEGTAREGGPIRGDPDRSHASYLTAQEFERVWARYWEWYGQPGYSYNGLLAYLHAFVADGLAARLVFDFDNA